MPSLYTLSQQGGYLLSSHWTRTQCPSFLSGQRWCDLPLSQSSVQQTSEGSAFLTPAQVDTPLPHQVCPLGEHTTFSMILSLKKRTKPVLGVCVVGSGVPSEEGCPRSFPETETDSSGES